MRLNKQPWAAVMLSLTLVAVNASGQATQYSWQQPHATVSGFGDLQWAPQPFTYSPGGSVVYIDYEGGDDNNSGTSQGSAFKHHPWDPNATGNAASTSGIRTYVFKRGVIYRGTLTADDNGQDGNPIILTSDPGWGSGEAMLLGSERVTTTWHQCTAGDAVTNLNPTNVWYTDLPFGVVDNPYGSFSTWPHGILPQTICEMTGDTGLARINICRAPNWTITDVNDPMGNWWNVTGPSPTQIALGESFSQTASSDWIGGSVWAQWGAGSGAGANMSTVQQGTINAFSNPYMTFDITTNPMCKFFIENLPQLLDAPNEYYYSKGPTHAGRLYIRLSGDRNPNNAIIEVGVRPEILRLVDRQHIEVSGLTFAVNNQPRPGTNPEPPHWNPRDGACQAIQLGGNLSGIDIHNCRFRYVSSAIAPRRDDQVNPTYYDGIRVTDNDIAYVDDQAITLGTKGMGKNIFVARNKLYHIGFRQTCRNYSAVPAINVVTAASAEIAGNIVHYCAGTGINTTSETATGAGPGNQIRVLVHHNKVTSSLLALNDYGGIEGWNDGPAYFFCNISGNARGYRHFSGENVYNPWGHAIYFDHAYNHVAFNNIVYGLHNSTSSAAQRNNSGFMQAVANTNYYFQNTIYRLYRGFCSRSPGSAYVGNLLDDITYLFHSEGTPVTLISYAKNVYNGSPQSFSSSQATFGAFQQFLENGNAETATLGTMASGAVMVNPSNRDFRPTGDAIGNGARFFMPWNLPNIVGQWQFHANAGDYTLIRGQNQPGSDPDNDLDCPGATAGSFVMGDLETWTNGALRFNGSSTYCRAVSSSPFNMTTNNFIVECYLRTSGPGVVVSKGNSPGYELDVTAGGNARIRLFSGGEYSLSSAAAVADNNWHHIVAEVDRTGSAVNMYVDGSLSNGATSGSMPGSGASLGNSANFEVGRNAGGNYFSGDMDFLRVAKGSFADGATSYDELHTWQFDGPAVRDFAGTKITGARDAGALNYSNIGMRWSANPVAVAPRISVRYLAASHRLQVHVGTELANDEPLRLSVLNAAGRVVWRTQTTTGKLGADRVMTIQTDRWARGVYLLRVSTAAYEQVTRLSMYR
ncbi:MAG: hypothetical protein GF331_22535 [Chitinivibrionales bacterium]|nr:hypothetical protein [Chitinivibrionales bacterium]